ncbi:MAG: serine hydrolase domain-containing protein [Ornithinibacter sp.]
MARFDTSGLDALVADGTLPGYAVAARFGDDVELVSGGVRDVTSQVPFEVGTIHRVASLSKPVAALLTLQLVEDGTLALDEPIASWLPELAHLRVLSHPDAELTDTVPLARPILLRQLLTMTSGLGISMESTPLSRAMAELGIHPSPAPPRIPAYEVLRAFAALPLAFQPGDGWAYHSSTDVLSLLLARAAKEDLEDLLERRVRVALELDVLGFCVTGTDVDRLATAYRPTERGLAPRSPWGVGVPPLFRTLSAGLFATAADVLAVFDELARPVTIGAASAALIRSPQVTEPVVRAAGPLLPPGYSYGCQVSVALEDDPAGPRAGSFGWSGGSGCLAVADQRAARSGVLLTNRELGSPDGSPAFVPFLSALYA